MFTDYFDLSSDFYDITTPMYLFMVRGIELTNHRLNKEQSRSKASDLIEKGGAIANKSNLV